MPKQILMCAPTFFDIEYEINPWMHKENQVDPDEAAKQWRALYNIYTEKLGWDVQLIEPVKGLPDMVFTANGALVFGGKVILPHFRYKERRGETEKFRAWFEAAGYQDIYLPNNFFEGEGDALIFDDRILFGGSPWRSSRPAHTEVGKVLGVDAHPLELIDPRFYHLDTCLTIVDSDTVAVYPKAFSQKSLAEIHELVPNVIEAGDKDALEYGLNAISNDGKSIVIPENARDLIEQYEAKSLNVYPTPISEFQKSGGGVKCLTLELR